MCLALFKILLYFIKKIVYHVLVFREIINLADFPIFKLPE